MAETVKTLPAMQEVRFWFLSQEDPLEEGMAPLSSILAWKIHGQRNLVGYSPCGWKESDMTEQLHFHFLSLWITEKAREFQNIDFCLIDYDKAFDCMDHNKLGEILKELGIPGNLTCLLWNL